MDDIAANHGAVFFQHSSAGYLRITGPGRMDFVQRQTTNDINLLAEGKALLTVLTSPTARILQVFYLFNELPAISNEALAAITLPGQSAQATRYLKSRVFFMDKVTVTDASSEFSQFDLFGPEIEESLGTLGFQAANLPAGSVIMGELARVPVRLLRHAQSIGVGFRLVAPIAGEVAIQSALVVSGITPLSEESYEILRIENGLPAALHELTEEFTPLEANLDEAIAAEKGCYTGQEVIARQVTYDKITRRLVGLNLEAALEPEASLSWEGKPAGTITSTAISPRFGPIALGIVRRAYLDPGTRLLAVNGAKSVNGVVCALPFKQE